VTAQQLSERSRPTEGIGDQLVGAERERRVDSLLALGDQMRSRGKRAGVERSETLEVAPVGWGGPAHGNRAPRGGEPIGIEPATSISVPNRHDAQYDPGSNRSKMLLSQNRS
jgi:hypothetical protein